MLRELLSPPEWLVQQDGHDPGTANVYETLFTVGNGRHGTRGSLEEGHHGDLPGVFLAGVFDSHDSIVTDLVNAPDWVDTVVHVGGQRLDVDSCRVVEHTRALDLAQGLLWRSTTFEDDEGRRTRLESLRFASMHQRDAMALRLDITPLNHSGVVEVSTGLDADRHNLEALPIYPPERTFTPRQRWAKWARSRHLATERVAATPAGVLLLQARTIGSKVAIGMAAQTWCAPAPARTHVRRAADRITRHTWAEVPQGHTVRLDKLVAVRTSRDVGATPDADVLVQAERTLEGLTVDGLLSRHLRAWERLWADCDASIEGAERLTKAVRLGIYHLLIAANPDDPTVNIGAKSMSGEGYRGHVFWDTEVMMLPFFTLTRPATARALLEYRFHTLDGARRNSAANGTAGARYAWESADTGDEECPRFTPDGKDRFWTRDEEVHVSADVAYAIDAYVEATGDESLLLDQGAEILFETSRFWTSFARVDDEGVWHLGPVMGPDEFHSHVEDNAFTNALVRWALRYAADVHDDLARQAPDTLARITADIDLSPGEVGRWRQVADGLAEPVRTDDGVVEQFAGYFDREYVPVTEWDANGMPQYPAGYHHFNCETTQLLKQPDVLQLALMHPDWLTAQQMRANFEYYEQRTLHKSSLSPAIHAILGIEVGDPTRAVQYFERSALVDLTDNQGNTCEGMHIASAAGTWLALTHGFGGLTRTGEHLSIHPWLPPQWSAVRYRMTWRGLRLVVEVRHGEVTLSATGAPGLEVTVDVAGELTVLRPDDTVTVCRGRESAAHLALAVRMPGGAGGTGASPWGRG